MKEEDNYLNFLSMQKKFPHRTPEEGWPKPDVVRGGGIYVYTFFQAEYWWPQSGERRQLTSLDRSHLINLLSFLERKASRFMLVYKNKSKDSNCIDPSNPANFVPPLFMDENFKDNVRLDDEPLVWMKKLPLYRALSYLKEARMHEKMVCSCEQKAPFDYYSFAPAQIYKDWKLDGELDHPLVLCPDCRSKPKPLTKASQLLYNK